MFSPSKLFISPPRLKSLNIFLKILFESPKNFSDQDHFRITWKPEKEWGKEESFKIPVLETKMFAIKITPSNIS